MNTVPMVEMTGITKRFPGVVANDHISLKVNCGEIHALLGENGAGKSTLVSILTGLYLPDEGEIRIKGKKVELSSPRDALCQGIGMVHQHFKLIKPFTVAENILLGLRGLQQVYRINEIEKQLRECSRQYGLNIDPSAQVWQLSVGEQQRVEIVKMLFRGSDILILDEPTAVLTPQETLELYKTLRKMADHGKAVIIISHKLNEVMQNTDNITVLRGGRYIGTVKTTATGFDKLARMMVGRDIVRNTDKGKLHKGAKVLELHHVSVIGDRGMPTLKEVSLDVCEGEILGIAGVTGNGQRDLAEVITGLRRVASGSIYLNNSDCTAANCRKRIDGGISYIPEDRLMTGLVPNLNTFENIILKKYRCIKGVFINWKIIRDYTRELIGRFEVKLASMNNPVKLMSGGNLQKLLLAREIESDPNLIVAMYPMRGLDVGASEGIHKLLLEQRSSGKALVLISEELEELFTLSDRIAVIHAGEIMGIVNPAETTIEAVGLMMAGQRMRECNAS